MANIIEYIFKFKDNASNNLARMAVAANNAANSFFKLSLRGSAVDIGFNRLSSNLGQLSARIDELRNKRDLLPAKEITKIRAINSELKSLERQMGKMQTLNGSWFKTKTKEAFMSMPGAGFFNNPITLIGLGLGASVKKGMEDELQRQNILTLMQGDSQGADKLFGQISDYGKKTVYNKAGLIESQKLMMSFGLSSDFAFDKLKQIGDIAMGDSSRMHSLALAFSQATSAGKLMGQDLLQMINAGFNPLRVISEKTGESMDSLRQKMSQGKISAEMLSQAFQWATEEGGRFYQGAEKAGETLSGKMNKLKDSLAEMGISIFSAIAPILRPILDMATRVFDSVGTGITWFVDKIKEGNPIVMGLAVAVGAMTVAFATYKLVMGIATFIQNGFTMAVLATNLAFLANPVFWVLAGISALVAGVVVAWKKFEGFRAVIYGVWEAMKGFGKILKDFVIDRIKGLLEGIGGMGKAISLLFSGDFKQAWEVAKKATKDITGATAVQNAMVSAQGLGDAYKLGAEKGRASFKADKEAKESKESKTNTTLLADIKKNTETNNGVSQSNTSSISSGGPKVVNITLGKFLDNINIYPQTFKESESDIEARLLELFGRVVVQGGYAQ